MDNVLVDFVSGMNRLDSNTREQYSENPDEVPGIFSKMDPMPNAIDSVRRLAEHYDLYILSTAPWLNPSAWSDKVRWIQEHFGKQKGSLLYKRLIISHHKNLNNGDYLIDDRAANGAENFPGEWLQFGSERFPDWSSITSYLLPFTKQ